MPRWSSGKSFEAIDQRTSQAKDVVSTSLIVSRNIELKSQVTSSQQYPGTKTANAFYHLQPQAFCVVGGSDDLQNIWTTEYVHTR
jgi:hypothetical protein